MSGSEPLTAILAREHRELDELFGRFLAAASAGSLEAATEAIESFDRELRRHTRLEEERLYPAAPARSLAPPPAEEQDARLFRELRLEHVQVRELSGMIRRVLAEKGDLEAARRLCGNLARRWDAHTAREERDAFRGACGAGTSDPPG
ncbi:MAG: hemerythrin domain-containing protein [Thermoanaerobaculia bacterium]